MNEVCKARLSFRKFVEGTGREELSAEGTGSMISSLPETAVAAQDVAPGLPDQHAVHRQHVQPHLKQNILQPTSSSSTELRAQLRFLSTSV